MSIIRGIEKVRVLHLRKIKVWLIYPLCLLCVMLVSAGCGTQEDPSYVIIDDSDPVSVAVDGNPEVKVVDDDGDIITIDEATRAIATIEYEHYEIHSGDSFSCWYLQDVSDIGDKTIIAFKTSNTTRWLHLIPTMSATVMAHARMYEAPTITKNTGASLSVYNRDRNSSSNSTVIDTSQTPNVVGPAMYFTEATMGNVTGGTEIAHEHLGTGEGKKTLGGSTRGQQEWILLQDTFYAFIIESVTDDDNTHVITLNWYEHTNLD